jgi:hypothetical protein
VFLKCMQEPTVTLCDTCIVFSVPVWILDSVPCVIKCNWNHLEYVFLVIYI